MPETRLVVDQPAGGISKQPAHKRRSNQVEDCTNFIPDLAIGLRKRNGCEFIATVSGLSTGVDYRLHPIDRDGTERYIAIYGPSGTVKVLHDDGTEATVSGNSGDVNTYLTSNSADADDLRLRTIKDTTFILNSTVSVGAGVSDAYTVTGNFRDYEVLRAQAPAADTYHRALADSTLGSDEGYYQYLLSSGETGFATWQHDDANEQYWKHPNARYNNAGLNPMGWGMVLQKESLSDTGLTYTHSGTTLSKVGAFSGYTFTSGDFIKVTAGANLPAAYYPVASKTDDDTIVITSADGVDEDNAAQTDPTTDSTSDVTIDGIYHINEVTNINFTSPGRTINDIYDVALEMQDKWQALGGVWANLLIQWNPTQENFTVISPFRGANATIINFFTPSSGADLTAGTGDDRRPFKWDVGNQTVTAGTGTQTYADRVVDLADRWEQTAPPNQADAQIDNTLMPVQMQRTAAGSPATFTISLTSWDPRISGDQNSNPTPSLWRDGDKITDISFDRDRLVLCGDAHIVYSAQGDLFNVYIDDVANLTDADPIDLDIAAEDVSLCNFLLPADDSHFVFCKNGQVFDANAPDTLSATSIRFTKVDRFDLITAVRPRRMRNRVYIASKKGDYGEIREYYYREETVSQESDSLSEHVWSLLPTTLKTILPNEDHDVVVCVDEDSRTLYMLQMHRSGVQRDQEAWTKLQLPSDYRIVDACFLGNELFMLVETTGAVFSLEKLDLSRAAAETGMPFPVHLDRLMTLENADGSYDGGADETTYTMPVSDGNVDTAIAGASHSTPGEALTVVSASGTSLVLDGNTLSGPIYAGRAFTSTVTLSEFFRRNDRGAGILDASLTSESLAVKHEGSGTYSLVTEHDLSVIADRTETKTASGVTLRSGRDDIFTQGKTTEITQKIQSTDHKPMNITGWESRVEFEAQETD